MRTRKTGREDIPALNALWQEAFGDEQQDIDLFFETVYPNATGFCAEDIVTKMTSSEMLPYMRRASAVVV